jgi:hypothetical protein
MVENFGTFNRLVVDFLTRVTSEQRSVVWRAEPGMEPILGPGRGARGGGSERSERSEPSD